MRRMMTIILAVVLCQQVLAQDEQRLTAEQVLAEMDSPTFVPTVKVGKVLHEGDSIQYMEMNNVYVYPQLTFKNKKQAQGEGRTYQARGGRHLPHLQAQDEEAHLFTGQVAHQTYRPRMSLHGLRYDQGLHGSSASRFLAGVRMGLRCLAEEGI